MHCYRVPCFSAVLFSPLQSMFFNFVLFVCLNSLCPGRRSFVFLVHCFFIVVSVVRHLFLRLMLLEGVTVGCGFVAIGLGLFYYLLVKIGIEVVNIACKLLAKLVDVLVLERLA